MYHYLLTLQTIAFCQWLQYILGCIRFRIQFIDPKKVLTDIISTKYSTNVCFKNTWTNHNNRYGGLSKFFLKQTLLLHIVISTDHLSAKRYKWLPYKSRHKKIHFNNNPQTLNFFATNAVQIRVHIFQYSKKTKRTFLPNIHLCQLSYTYIS